MRPVSNDFPVLPRQMPSVILSVYDVYPLAPQLPASDGNGRSGGCVLLSLQLFVFTILHAGIQ